MFILELCSLNADLWKLDFYWMQYHSHKFQEMDWDAHFIANNWEEKYLCTQNTN